MTPIDDAVFTGYLVPRFLNYVRIWTTSARHPQATPSTPGQWDLAKRLAEELQGLGLADVTLTGHCYVIARLPATLGKEQAPAIGLLAHLDTSSDAPGKDVHPQLVKNYNGKRIELADGLALDLSLIHI